MENIKNYCQQPTETVEPSKSLSRGLRFSLSFLSGGQWFGASGLTVYPQPGVACGGTCEKKLGPASGPRFSTVRGLGKFRAWCLGFEV